MKTIGWLFLLTLIVMSPAAAQRYTWGGPHGYGEPPPDSYYSADVQFHGGPDWYCRYGWASCNRRGWIRRYHTPEHCWSIPEDCED